MNQNQGNELENMAVSAIAAASKTPFKTAFKITFGIAVANVLIGLLFMAGCATIATVSYMVVK